MLIPRGLRCAVAALLSLASVGAAQSAVVPKPPAVVNSRALGPWVQKARTGRADAVALGDSNQAFQGHGWDHGWTKAISDEFGLYATELLSPGENEGWGAQLGYSYGTLAPFPSDVFSVSHAPEALDVFMQSGGMMSPLNYLYLPEGETAVGANNQGMYVEPWSPLDVRATLRFRVVYGKFSETTPGSFMLSAKSASFPYGCIAKGEVTTTATSGNPGLRLSRLDLHSDEQRFNGINFRFSPPEIGVTGPFIAFLMRVENRDRAMGASFHTLYAKGSQSARDMAEALRNATDQYLSMYFFQARVLQSAPVRVMIRINTGLNDRNESKPSVGPAHVADGSSAAAFADNIVAIVDRINEVWHLNGWDPAELCFLVSVSHPISNPDDAMLMGYRAAADALTGELPSTASVRFDRLTDSDEMEHSGWYQSGGTDHYHLTQAAYEVLAERELGAAMATPCATDLNTDGATDVVDLVTLLGAFGTAVPRWTGADTDGNGMVDTSDLVRLLGEFGRFCR